MVQVGKQIHGFVILASCSACLLLDDVESRERAFLQAPGLVGWARLCVWANVQAVPRLVMYRRVMVEFSQAVYVSTATASGE